MPWAAIIGGGLAYMASENASDGYSDAANRASKAGAFKPYNVYSGFGSGAFSPATAGSQGYYKRGPEINQALTGNARIGYPSYAQGEWVPGTPGTPATATAELNPRYQALRDQYMAQAEGFNGALTSYDPQSTAGDLYSKLQSISAPQRQQEQNAFEARLLSQGQMGLQQGGVNPLMASYLQSQKMQDLQRELSAFGLSQDVLDRMQNRSLSATTAASNLDALALQNLNLGGSFGGQAMQGGQFGANLQNNAAMRSADATAQLWSGIGQQVSTAFKGSDYNDSYFTRNSQYSPSYGGGAYGGSNNWAP